MRRFNKIFILFMTFIVLILSSCSFVSGSDDMVIDSITTSTDSSGDVVVTITFTSEDYEPVKFNIPKGDKGDKGDSGTSISGITTKKLDSGETLITISFDDDIEDVSFKVKDGTSFKGITSVLQSDGSYKAYVEYTDGTKDEAFTIPAGNDGNGITDLDQEVDEDGNIKLTFKFSKSSDVVVTIPKANDGQDGKGIKSIVSSESDNNYILTITYTDDTTEDFSFTKPSINTWYSRPGQPEAQEGNDGDFYFDSLNAIIYKKVSGTWSKITTIKTETVRYKVTFDLNADDDPNVSFNISGITHDDGFYCSIRNNNYFSASGLTLSSVTPTRQGYKFLGWFSTKVTTTSTSQFTDFTPVLADITLYAHWEAE